MLSHLRENEKCDGFNFKETQADHMSSSSLSATNLDSELKTIEDALTFDHHEYSKNEINEGPHQPLDFKYPINNGRKFQKNWFDQFPWLEYYGEVKRAFCFPCRMFKIEVLGCSEKSYTEIGFQNWKKGAEKFKSHESSEAHKSSTERLRAYESSLRKGSVTVQLISQGESEMEENKKYLQSICKTLLFCVRQGIALRGHDEREDSSNRGTFLELLNLRSKDNALIKKSFIENKKTFFLQ
ncbi:hypothetical protein AVEN_212619-1 [Araneus ventricosus]|uniref:TTF-type domain-containing protein n=1 Tax=Araneus ventricosus TaxID=182803 RepID=A0A4Y2LHN2_ARAVE|nr:hypothetical protein AVEN_212619-1 [Araneus ventricosus]